MNPELSVHPTAEAAYKALLQRIHDWASDPEFNLGSRCYYGDAQMHVLGIIAGIEPDVTRWVKGRYKRVKA